MLLCFSTTGCGGSEVDKEEPGIVSDILAIGVRRLAFEVVKFTRRYGIRLVGR
jgi:hypothetical protein